MAKLICAGHISLDLPFRSVDRTVFDRDSTFAESAAVTTGGDALNNAATLTKLGLGNDMKYVSIVGDDAFGKITLADLEAAGVDTSYIKCKKEVSSFVTVNLIKEDGERHFLCYGSANRNLTVEDVLSEIDEDTEHLHIGSFMSLDGLEGENMVRMFRTAKEKGIRTSFDVTYDTEGKWLEKIKDGLPYTDIMFASFDEAVALSGCCTPKKIGEFFRSMGVKQFVLKNGADGCYATDFDAEYYVPAYHCRPVVDTTGAGDSFVAGYLFGLLHGLTMEECCVLGSAEAAMCISKLGAHTGTGNLRELMEFISENGGLTMKKEELVQKLGDIDKKYCHSLPAQGV